MCSSSGSGRWRWGWTRCWDRRAGFATNAIRLLSERIHGILNQNESASVTSEMASLHIEYAATPQIQANLSAWDAAIASEGALGRNEGAFLAFWPAASSATTSASTGIEGNPLTPGEVDELLSGRRVDASEVHRREVQNYNSATEYARALSIREAFTWSEEQIHAINAQVMAGLPDDTHGEYRQGEVNVGIYRAPSPLLVPRFMEALVEWLVTVDEHPLILSALLHLNVIAIHPFLDGNGRTARVLSSLALMRGGVSSPELVSIEPYLRRNRDEYVDMLRLTLGETYYPEEHQATPWLDYYTRISVERLRLRNRVRDTIPNDLGQIYLALSAANEPTDWVPILLAAAIRTVRTNEVAEWTHRSNQAARALLLRMSERGWLTAEGRTRSRRYSAGPALRELPLRTPGLSALQWAGEDTDQPEQTTLWDRPPAEH
jgi:Fic family protein